MEARQGRLGFPWFYPGMSRSSDFRPGGISGIIYRACYSVFNRGVLTRMEILSLRRCNGTVLGNLEGGTLTLRIYLARTQRDEGVCPLPGVRIRFLEQLCGNLQTDHLYWL